MKFAVIGGDQRTLTLCSFLERDGHEVCTFALDRAEGRPPGKMSRSAREAAIGADCVILPLPAEAQGGLLNAPLCAGEYQMEDILDAVPPGTPVCAGMASEGLFQSARRRGLELFDYLRREEMAVENAVATAEGAIALIMRETAVTLSGLRVLIVGFGRIGKALAHRLHGLGAFVTVSARSCGDRAWIRAYGYAPADTGALEEVIGDFEVVVNTVPARVLGEARLRGLLPGALCVDLASKPGGVDFAAASMLGIKAVWALSLPGKTAPESAGRMIRDTIYNIMKEREL